MVLTNVEDRRAPHKEADDTRILGARAGVHGHEEVQRGLEGVRELRGGSQGMGKDRSQS